MTGKMFNGIFSAHCFLLCSKSFIINKGNRKTGTGVFGTRPCIMRFDTFFQIIGPAGVVSTIAALYNISVIHNKLLKSIRLSNRDCGILTGNQIKKIRIEECNTARRLLMISDLLYAI